MGLFFTFLSGFKATDYLTALFTFIFLYVIHFYYKHFTRINPLPGPLPIPLIGSFEIFKNDIDAWFYRLNKQYKHDGVFELNIAGNRQVVITRADYVEKFLASNSSSINHIMRTANNGLLDLFDLETKGVGLNHSYQHWKFNRHIFSQAIMPLSSTDKPSKYVNSLFEEMSSYWMNLKKPDEDSITMDISTWMRRFTSDFIALISTGKQLNTIQHFYRKTINEEVTEEMIDTENFIEAINVFVSDNQTLFVPKVLRNFPFIKSRVDSMLDNCRYFYGRLVELIRKKRKELEIADYKVDPKEMDLITSLIVANTKYDPHPQKYSDPSLMRPMTDDEIRGVMFDAFVAGTDTTVNTFCFALYYLAHNPHIKKKLVEEIETVFKDDLNRPVTYEDLDNLKYVEAVVKETSRIRPTVSMVSRFSSKPDEVAGYKWPSNVLFILYVRGINNNPLYWKDPEKFEPERFLDPKLTENHPKNSFSMFGGGPRMCLGRKVAIIELKTLLTLVYRKYDVELVDMQAPLDVETSTITICKELNVRLIPRVRTA
ncbi:hypothetical protein RclHR1_01940003 [Rhizophagus clarus]|uniref:Cytochrome P450 n=1 Tax=Rhizophagus clarus TaxID=94130 RepID=A0A2Z6RHR7_9GLOM|nr:hypothetical protein RclHR1_01940003 [Rhizophagus clarus]GES93656.1 cytochrome P450 [Rhizophagus clarus]